MADSTSPFNPRFYYRFFNDELDGTTMAVGQSPTVNTTVNMTTEQVTTSSENWQIFSQSDVYFIRNYQGGAELQLGLTSDSPTLPRLLNRSGALGQQWALNKWDDGTWRMTNMLVGNSTALGIAGAGDTQPAMDSSEGDEHWNISINISAGEIKDEKMLSNVTNVEVSACSYLPERYFAGPWCFEMSQELAAKVLIVSCSRQVRHPFRLQPRASHPSVQRTQIHLQYLEAPLRVSLLELSH